MPRSANTSALGAALVAIVLWASAFVGIRAAGEDLSPGALSLLRLLIGAALLGAVVVARGERMPPRRDLPGLLVCGLLWFGVYNVALNEAERRVDAGTAAMLVNIAPVLLAAIAGVVLREGFPRSLVLGCVVALAGTTIIGLATSDEGVEAGWGAVLCVVAALAYAITMVVQKPILERSSGLVVTWVACSVGAVACLPFAPTLVGELGRADGGAIAWAVYLGVFPTAVGFTFWAYALARTSAGGLGALTYLVPPIAIFMGWALLGESPPALAFLGGALCLAGVMVTRGVRAPRRRGSRRAPRA